ncbi:hypothetical protein ACQ4PT_056756 [Festuca glaucescens]
MAQEERELQVRALDGRSIAVTLAAAASVRDLKAALRSSFPPAQISHNFHIFLKGAKLRSDAKIDSLVVSHGEFIVLVPFTRKSAQFPPVATPGEEQSVNPPISSEVAAGANSAWQDIMDDLSSIPSSPHAADAASKDLYSSTIPYAGSYAEDVSTGKSPSTGSSRKRRKLCKENGGGSRDTSGVDSASEQPSTNKKSGFVKSAASSCHIVHIEEIPCRGASYAELPPHLSEALREALESIGISRLYSHQSEAIQSSISGKHVAVATSTSSGKSLCYNIPVLESLSQDLTACALYIFPTKALAQDQLRTLMEMKKAFNADIDINIYDGDTPREDRLWIRDNARLVNSLRQSSYIHILYSYLSKPT